jgi:hypothetical protein
MSVDTGKYRKRLPKLSAEELELYRADPHREELLGIHDYVVCRECAARTQYIGVEHLRSHEDRTVRAYRHTWGGAPTYSPLAKARRLGFQQDWVSRQDPEALREYKHNEYMGKRAERIAAATQRNREHRKEHHQAQAKYRASEQGKENARRRRKQREAKIAKALKFLQGREPNQAERAFAQQFLNQFLSRKLSLTQIGWKLEKKFSRKFSKSSVRNYLLT